MAIAISGAVIVNNQGLLKYKKKCEYCSYVDVGTTTCAMVKKYTTMNTSFVCPKCKKKVNLIIKGE